MSLASERASFEHPPTFGCGCDRCFTWVSGRVAARDRDPIGWWWKLYRPHEPIPERGRWPP